MGDLSPLTERPGAVAGGVVAGSGESSVDAAVAAHYGDPMREQRQLAAGEALVDLSHRDVVTVTGPDRLTWVNSLTTQKIDALAPGQSAEDIVLSPKGHVEHVLHLVDDGTTLWITTEPGRGQELTRWLDMMRFMKRVEVALVTDRYAVIGSSRAADLAVLAPGVAERAVATWLDPWPGTVQLDGAWTLAGDTAVYGPLHPHPGTEFGLRESIVPRVDLVAAVGDSPLAGMWALEALRVASWRPRFGFETDHRTIVHEVDWLRTGVHLHKGCYRGQETVARVHNLGKPPRRLAFVHLDGSGHELPSRGAEVFPMPDPDAPEGARPARAIGFLTSVAQHHELGPIGLVLIKRNSPVADLLIDGVAAAQEVIVEP